MELTRGDREIVQYLNGQGAPDRMFRALGVSIVQSSPTFPSDDCIDPAAVDFVEH